MSGGFQGNMSGRRPKPSAPSAAGQGAPACGLSSSISPAERFQRAVEAGPLTFAERCAFRSQLAHVAAQDEERRSAGHPQHDLPLDIAA